MVTRSNETSANIRVLSSDRLRYAVYEGNKVYLLNTDYDLPITVKLMYGDGDSKEKEIILEPLELKSINL